MQEPQLVPAFGFEPISAAVAAPAAMAGRGQHPKFAIRSILVRGTKIEQSNWQGARP
jgi:hypothetical protein